MYVTVNGGSTVMASELHVDAIKHSGGTSAMTIDSSGRVRLLYLLGASWSYS